MCVIVDVTVAVRVVVPLSVVVRGAEEAVAPAPGGPRVDVGISVAGVLVQSQAVPAVGTPLNGAGSAPRSPLARKVTGSVIFGRSSSVMAARSFEDEVQIKALRERVAEVEKALADAEDEIEQVVSKMNTAQIEVMNLQEEREAAVRETRRLQRAIESEQAKSFEQRFRTLTGVVV